MHTGTNIFDLEIRIIVLYYFFKRKSRAYQFKNV